MRRHVVIAKRGRLATQLREQDLSVQMVAALTRLDHQPGDVSLEQRLNHPAEALGPDFRLVALGMKDKRGHLVTRRKRIHDLAPPTCSLVDKVPAPLPRQTKRPRKPAKSMHIPIGDYRHADVITRTPARLVDKRLSTHPLTITHGRGTPTPQSSFPGSWPRSVRALSTNYPL